MVDYGDGYAGVSNCNMQELCSLFTHSLAEEMDSLLKAEPEFEEAAEEILTQFERFYKEAVELAASALKKKWVEKEVFDEGLHNYIAEIEDRQWYERSVRY